MYTFFAYYWLKEFGQELTGNYPVAKFNALRWVAEEEYKKQKKKQEKDNGNNK